MQPSSASEQPGAASGTRRLVLLVIPMYNEADAFDVLFARLDTVLPTLTDYDFEVVCVK